MAKILLVEDEPGLAEVIIKELERHGYTVFHAGDGISALKMRQQHQPDLVILDWMIPALDGLEVLRKLRESSPLPVMMLTSRSDEADRVLGLELGADDYLTKPFSMRELAARVGALLRMVQRVQQIVAEDRQKHDQVLRYRNLSLDPDRRQASVGGRAVDLTPIEFDFLSLLLRHPGRVFNRAYLHETVWDSVYVEGDRSVDNAVLRIRRKLGDLGEDIETVWGVGYRLRRSDR